MSDARRPTANWRYLILSYLHEIDNILLRALAAPAADASPLPPSAKGKGASLAFQRAQKNLDGNLPIERLKSAESCNLAASNRTGFEARRRRLARSAHAIEAERGARRPRWRPPEAARDLRLHGDLRRRLVAGEVCRIASTPTTASSPLSFLRRRLVGVSTRSSHCQDPAGSTAPWIVRNRSKVLLTLTRRAHKACSHRALIHSVRTTQRLASPPRPHLLFS